MTREMKIHPAAKLFPMIEGEEFKAFVKSIKENGLDQPIITLDGAILDGRNRYRACQEAKVRPRYDRRTSKQVKDPYGLVVTLNLDRRHLTASQRAMIAADLKTAYANEGKGRQRAAGGSKTRKGKSACGKIATSASKPSKNGKRQPPAREKAGQQLKVSPRTVDAATVVKDHGSKKLIAMVKAGEIAVGRAADLCKACPKRPDQDRALKDGPNEVKATIIRGGVRKSFPRDAKPPERYVDAKRVEVPKSLYPAWRQKAEISAVIHNTQALSVRVGKIATVLKDKQLAKVKDKLKEVEAMLRDAEPHMVNGSGYIAKGKA